MRGETPGEGDGGDAAPHPPGSFPTRPRRTPRRTPGSSGVDQAAGASTDHVPGSRPVSGSPGTERPCNDQVSHQHFPLAP